MQLIIFFVNQTGIMKNLFLAIFLSLFAACIVLGCDPPPGAEQKDKALLLCGKVRNITLEKRDGEISRVSAVLDLQLKNTGSKAIIIMPELVSVFRGRSLAENVTAITYYHNPGPSWFRPYDKTRNTYDKPTPIFDKVVVIQPGGSWSFTDSLMLDTTDSGMTDAARSWTEIKAKPPFYLAVTIFTSDEHLARDSERIEANPLWSKLRDRWSKYGHLWLDIIESDKMLLDLNSVPIKITDSEFTKWNVPKRCEEWQANVDPRIKIVKPVERRLAAKSGFSYLRKDAKMLPLYSELSEKEVFEAMDCFLKLKGRKHDSSFGVTRPDTSQTFDLSSVEVAALYYISVLFYQEWGHAGAAVLTSPGAVGNSSEVVSKAYNAYEKWLDEIKKIGLETARARKLDPLARTRLRWY